MKLKNTSGEVVMIPGFEAIAVDAVVDVDGDVYTQLSRCPALEKVEESATFLEDTEEPKKFVSKKSK